MPYEYIAQIKRSRVPSNSGIIVAVLFQANIMPPHDNPIRSIVIETANRPMPSQSMAFNLSTKDC